MPRTFPILASALVLAAACLAPWSAPAEVCPGDQPTWISGRTVVWEPNLDPPQIRGVGEVFVYAFEPGDSTAGTRFMAVSDADGYFCIHDTTEGDWAVTAFEPFHFRPFVREIHCDPAGCDLGEISLDQSLLRISDDYIDYGDDWWGGPWAQTLEMPAGATHAAKITFRVAGDSNNAVELYEGEGLLGTMVGSSAAGFHGGRGTAVFPAGEVAVQAGGAYTVLLDGGSAPWRDDSDPYAGGQMASVDGQGTMTHVAGTDLCLTLDVDGVDGLGTHFLVASNDGWVYGDTVAQSFVARTPAITHASMVVGSQCDFCRIQASIGDTPDGDPIGPTKETIGLHEQGVAFAWFEGEVPVTEGQTYYVRYHFPEGWSVAYSRAADALGNDVYPAGQAYADGNPEATDLWGRVMGPQAAGDDDDDAGDDDAGDDDGGGDDDAGDDDGGDDDAGDDDDAAGDDDAGGAGDCSCRVAGGAPALAPLMILSVWLWRLRHH